MTPTASKTPRASALSDSNAKAKSTKTRQRRSTVDTDPPGFAQWYQAYPRKEAVADARAAYAKALARGADPTVLLEAAQRYATRQRRTERRYVKMPATWLRADCWKDDPTPDRPTDSRHVSTSFDRFRELQTRRKAS